MNDLSSTFVPKLPQGLMFEREGSLSLLLHPDKPRWAVTNELGQEIVGLCDGKTTVGSIVSTIARRYEQNRARVEEDVTRFLTNLADAGILICEDDESSESQSLVRLKSIFLHLTDRCNLRCTHCYAASGVQKTEELHTDSILGLIEELAEKKGRAFILSGGEPLLRKDWAEILGRARDCLERVTVNTNGTLIDDQSAELLARIRPRIQISLDGPTAEVHDAIRGEGSFERSVRGIQILQDKELGDELVICMTLMRQNISSAPKMIDTAQRLGVPRLRFLPLHRQGRASASWDRLDASRGQYLKWFQYIYSREGLDDLEVNGGLSGFWLSPSDDEDEENAWCPIGRKVVVTASGDVYPCALLMNSERCLGNVTAVSLADIEESPKLHELTSACFERRTRIEECRRCSWRNFCQGSCPAMHYLHQGTLWAADEYCDFRKKLYRDTIFRSAIHKLQSTDDTDSHG